MRTTSLALPILALLATCSTARAEQPPLPADGPLSRPELSDLRGGMMIGGIPIDFVVVIRTTAQAAQGPIGLQTTVNVDDAGKLASSITTAVGTALAQALPGSGSGGADQGMQLQLPNGSSIIHDISQNQVRTLIANRLDGQVFNQNTDLNVTLPNFQGMSHIFGAHMQAGILGRDAALAGIGRL